MGEISCMGADWLCPQMMVQDKGADWCAMMLAQWFLRWLWYSVTSSLDRGKSCQSGIFVRKLKHSNSDLFLSNNWHLSGSYSSSLYFPRMNGTYPMMTCQSVANRKPTPRTPPQKVPVLFQLLASSIYLGPINFETEAGIKAIFKTKD